MFEYKAVLGIIGIIIAFVAYIPYFRDIFSGKTKPHAYSWLVWGILTGTAFFGQLFGSGGAGAWVTAFTAMFCFVIFFLALNKGEKNITFSDKLSLLAAAFALILWFVTNSPLISIILITFVDIFGFYPTFRKSYHKPKQETLITYFLSGTKWVIAIIALENYSVVTWLYPASLIFLNFTFVILITIRKKQLH